MKWFDLTKLAAKNLKGRWTALPMAGVAVAAFCLCFSGAILTKVQQEKTVPYELVVASEGTASLSDSLIAEISEIPDVEAATAIVQVPASMKTGKYSAQMTLTGIDAAYLEEMFLQGIIFPDSSVMPYIVLNEAACKLFSEDGKGAGAETPEIDWLNASYSLQTGVENRVITSKVCGILAEGEKETEQHPAAYICLSVAKELLRKSGQSADLKAARVRITNIGRMESVSKVVADLGLNVTNSNEELQARWDAEMKEMRYLLVIGAFCLLYSAALLSARKKVLTLEQKGALEMLRWLGMKQGDMNGLFLLQSLTLSFFGILLGLIVSLSLPSFLPPELVGVSFFTLPIPFRAIAASAIICTSASLFPLLNIKIGAD